MNYFDESNPKLINKKWLQDVVKNYYTPIVEVNDYPKFLIPFIDIYVAPVVLPWRFWFQEIFYVGKK